MAEITWDENAIDELMAIDGPVHKEGLRRVIKAERRAKQICPVDTGRARTSITHDNGTRRGHRTIVFRLGSDVEYFPHIELGTSRMAARAPLRGGLDAAR